MEVKTGLEKIILAFIFAVFILPEAIFCSSTLEDVSNSMKIFISSTSMVFWKYGKILKAQCSSSNKTCENLSCRVKAVSRTDSLLNLHCSFNRKLNRYFVSRRSFVYFDSYYFHYFFRSTSQFRTEWKQQWTTGK